MRTHLHHHRRPHRQWVRPGLGLASDQATARDAAVTFGTSARQSGTGRRATDMTCNARCHRNIKRQVISSVRLCGVYVLLFIHPRVIYLFTCIVFVVVVTKTNCVSLYCRLYTYRPAIYRPAWRVFVFTSMCSPVRMYI